MVAEPFYGTSAIKRHRRTAAEVDQIRRAIIATFRETGVMTVRQMFYQLVGKGVVAKTEAEYKGTVCRLLVDMRRDGTVPYGYIADNTRWQRKPQTDSNLEVMLRRTLELYRRSLWDDQGVYVEIWLEKDALAGVLTEVTYEWDVPLMVTRGYPSLTFVHAAAEAISAIDRPTFIYYFGDHDPSGADIPRFVEQQLRESAPDADITFGRVAVNRDQIALWNLPTRPTKASDSRSRNFEGESVEVDAIPPYLLRDLTRQVIEQHIDRRSLAVTKIAEETEREQFSRLIAREFGG